MSSTSSHLVPVAAGIAVLCYLIGSIPFGLLVGWLRGIDIRQHGSGNIGATNVWRVLGKKWGLPVFLLDVAKGLCAAILGKWLSDHWAVTVPLPHLRTTVVHLDTAVGGIVGSMAAILGHNFPLWLRFRGGKGVATSLGVLFGLMPLASFITFAVWGLIFKLSRYVSLASILAALSLPLTVLALFMVPLPWGMRGWAYFYFVVVATTILVVRHAANIKRLLDGTENRMGSKKPEPRDEEEPPTDEATPPEAAPPIAPPVAEPMPTRPREPEVIDAEWTRVDENRGDSKP